MTLLHDKYRKQLETLIAAKDPSEHDILNTSIAELRHLNERLIQKNADIISAKQATHMRQALNHVTDAFLESHKKAQQLAKMRYDNLRISETRFITYIAGFVFGCFFVIAALIITQSVGLLDIAFGPDAQRRQIYDDQFLADHKIVPTAVQYLQHVENVIKHLQKEEPEKLNAIAGKGFVPLAKIDPELNRQKPSSLPKYSGVVLQANKTAYKILMNWPLCSAAKWTNPKLVDPVRGSDRNRCSHFGVWNNAGAGF